MTTDHSHQPRLLAWKDLHKIKLGFDEPFALQLEDEQLFIATNVVRLIPNRRMVAFGLWHGEPAVAKLFFDKNHAERHMKKDVTGVKTLTLNKIPTPALQYEGRSADKRVYVLIFERIFDAQSLEQALQSSKNIHEHYPILEMIVDELATHHVLGILQRDLHLKNFLVTSEMIYTLDGGDIEIFSQPLSEKVSMNSLALFLSQLGVGVEVMQEKLFRHYCKMRAWLIKDEDVLEMTRLIKKHNERRWHRFEKKIFRNSTDFARLSEVTKFGMYDRGYAQPELIAFMQHPDSVFVHKAAQILKAGSSSTVIKIKLDGREFVIKRNNLKSFWHRIRRCLRATRASKSWRLAQKLGLFGVATAKPVAFIEHRFLCFRGKSYFVCEYVPGDHADKYFLREAAAVYKSKLMVRRIADLLLNLAKLDITHGDLKITNILINQQEHPLLIDLDGTTEHVSPITLHHAWRKEIKRFLENFNSAPTLRESFQILFK